MAKIRTMFPKAESPLLPYLIEADRKRAVKTIAAYDLKMKKEAMEKKKNDKTA